MSAGRILVVDDQPQMRRFMRSTLTSAGYEIDDAKTGEEALNKLRDFHPDLIVLDMNMPGMGGLAACREIRASTSIGIIMLTVRNSEADKVAALDAGADDFVTKPFSTPELLARIRAALRRVPAAQSAAGKIRVGRLVVDFGARTIFNGAIDRAPDAKGTRPPPLSDATSESGGVPSGAATGDLGTRLRRPGRLPSGDRQESAQKARSSIPNSLSTS